MLRHATHPILLRRCKAVTMTARAKPQACQWPGVIRSHIGSLLMHMLFLLLEASVPEPDCRVAPPVTAISHFLGIPVGVSRPSSRDRQQFETSTRTRVERPLSAFQSPLPCGISHFWRPSRDSPSLVSSSMPMQYPLPGHCISHLRFPWPLPPKWLYKQRTKPLRAYIYLQPLVVT